jgi:hypothetical protein
MLLTKKPRDLTPEDASAACAAAPHGDQALSVRGGMLAWEKAGLATERAGGGA